MFLILIFFWGFVLRIVGVGYGYPFAIGHFDEVFSVRAAMAIAATKSLQPINLKYPALFPTLLTAFYSFYYLIGRLLGAFQTPADFAFLYMTRPFNLYLIARLLSVLAGGLTVLFTYQIAKVIYGRRIGLFAAGLLALSTTHLIYSHWAKPDVFMVFLVTISLLFTSFIMAGKGRLKNYLLAGLFAGLAISAKYNALWVVTSLFAVHLFVSENKNPVGYFINKKLWLYLLMLVVGFFIGSPYCFLNPRFFYQEVSFIMGMLRFGELGNLHNSPWWVFTYLIKEEAAVGVIFLSGMVYCLFKPKKEHWIFLSFILVFLLLTARYSKTSLHYILPIFPAMAILGAVFLDKIFSSLWSKSRLLCQIFSLLLSISILVKVCQAEGSFLSKDSRITAKEWIEQHIPENSKIALFALRYRDLPPIVSVSEEFSSMDYGPKARKVYRDKRLEDLLRNYYSDTNTYRIYKLEKEFSDETANKLLSSGGIQNDIYLKGCYKQDWKSLAELKTQGIEYLVISSFLSELYEDKNMPPRNHPLYILYKNGREYFYKLLHSSEVVLLKEIIPKSDLGPTIRIYRMVYNGAKKAN